MTLLGPALRLAALPIAAALAASILLSFSPNSDVLVMLLGIPAATLWLIVVAIIAAIALWRRQWRKLAQCGLAVMLSFLLGLAAMRVGDYVHLAVMYPTYAARIARTRERPLVFGWGGSGFAGIGNVDYELVYDPSDEAGSQSGERMLADHTPVWVRTRHLIGGFYKRSISYP